jgi:hypothetical protein
MQWFKCRSRNTRYLITIVTICHLQLPQISSTAGESAETILVGGFAGEIKHGSVMGEY